MPEPVGWMTGLLLMTLIQKLNVTFSTYFVLWMHPTLLGQYLSIVYIPNRCGFSYCSVLITTMLLSFLNGLNSGFLMDK